MKIASISNSIINIPTYEKLHHHSLEKLIISIKHQNETSIREALVKLFSDIHLLRGLSIHKMVYLNFKVSGAFLYIGKPH